MKRAALTEDSCSDCLLPDQNAELKEEMLFMRFMLCFSGFMHRNDIELRRLNKNGRKIY